MRTWLKNAWSHSFKFTKFALTAAFISLLCGVAARAGEVGGEAGLKLPDLSQVSFLGVDGHKLLLFGIIICVFGLLFGLVIYTKLKNMPVHKSMLDISELIYETCKTYLFTQGKFLMFLWVFIAIVIVLYFGILSPFPENPSQSRCRLFCSSVSSASPEVTAWRGSEFASIHLPTRALRSPACAASPIPFIRRRSKRA